MIKLFPHYKKILILALCLLVGTPLVTYADGNGFIVTALFNLVANVFGTLLGLCASILNAGINEFVIRFADNFTGSGVGRAVDSVWVIIRDFMNLAFIFGVLYIGFKIILNSDDSQTRA